MDGWMVEMFNFFFVTWNEREWERRRKLRINVKPNIYPQHSIIYERKKTIKKYFQFSHLLTFSIPEQSFRALIRQVARKTLLYAFENCYYFASAQAHKESRARFTLCSRKQQISSLLHKLIWYSAESRVTLTLAQQIPSLCGHRAGQKRDSEWLENCKSTRGYQCEFHFNYFTIA